MPLNRRKEKPALSAAKGKFGKSFANELFAQVNNLFYEFGLIGQPRSRDDKQSDDK